jgi:transposase
MEKRFAFAPRQRASPQRFVCEASQNITVLEHPPYSPDLAPCDFYLFPKIKSVLKGTHFLSVEDMKAKMTEILNNLSKNDL